MIAVAAAVAAVTMALAASILWVLYINNTKIDVSITLNSWPHIYI